MGNLFGHTSKRQTLNPGSIVRAHHDQVAMLLLGDTKNLHQPLNCLQQRVARSRRSRCLAVGSRRELAAFPCGRRLPRFQSRRTRLSVVAPRRRSQSIARCTVRQSRKPLQRRGVRWRTNPSDAICDECSTWLTNRWSFQACASGHIDAESALQTACHAAMPLIFDSLGRHYDRRSQHVLALLASGS